MQTPHPTVNDRWASALSPIAGPALTSPALPAPSHAERFPTNPLVQATVLRAAQRSSTALATVLSRGAIGLASFLLVLSIGGLPALGQYSSIVEHKSEGNSCGSPGSAGCPVLPTCTAPSGNSLRDDKYTHLIKCDLPGSAEWGGEGSETTPLILQEYNDRQAVPSDTIYTSTDLHFGKPTVSDADHANHTNLMNQFATSGTHWPRGVGFPDESIHPPAAIVTTGDDTHYGHQDQLGDFRLLYEQGWVNESTGYPVLPGMGNHDADGQCADNNCAQRMFDYVAGHLYGATTSFDKDSDNYSWDWNGVHYIQLNLWAGDTELGTNSDGSVYKTHLSGLPWLITDLASRLGVRNTPVIIFQHFGYDCFSLGTDGPAINSTCGDSNSPWWSKADRQSFWNAIQGYNVVGIFSGHVHSTGMYDVNEFGGHLDNFVGGTGGEDPCLNINASDAPCGGRGHFFAIRVKGNFLDVASLEWTSDTKGNPRTGPAFTNLNPTPANGMSPQGPAFTGGQLGCRKLINSRIVDVSQLAPTPAGIPSGNPITITNTSKTTIPGPIALEFEGLDAQGGIDLTSKSFVDRCAAGGNSFMYPDNGSTGSLAPGKSLTFTPVYSAPAAPSYHLVRAGLSKGASPMTLTLVGTPHNPPPPGTITIYGPPNVAFQAVNSIQTATKDWLAVTPANGAFDRFGTATLTYTPNRASLLNDTIDATEISLVTVVTNNPLDEIDLNISLHLRVADNITLTLSPSKQVTAGTASTVTAVLHYKPVVNTDAGGTYLATGTMTLNDITNPNAHVALSNGYLNSGCDPTNDPNCPQEPDNTVILPAVTLSAGVHVLQVGYTGDSFYAPNTSAIFEIEVGQPVLSLTSQPSGLALSLSGQKVVTPATEDVPFQATYTLAAPTPQSGRLGVRYLFDHWADTWLTYPSRQVTIGHAYTNYTAVFDTQYLVKLLAIPSNGGTIAATDEPADEYYPSGSQETVTATPNPGYYFTGFTGGLEHNKNPQIFNVSGSTTINANFALTTAPTITWKPAPLLSGTALRGAQLDATANVQGTYVYTPKLGFVPPLGLGYVLKTVFTPTNPAYAVTTTTAKVNVVAKAAPTLGANVALASSSSSTNISVALSITNLANGGAANLALTSATIGTTNALSLPTIPNIAGLDTTTVGIAFPRSAGAKGTKATLTLAGTYAEGVISYSTQVVLP